MRKIITATLLGGAIAASLLGAGAAQATTAKFQQRAQEEMPFVVQQYGMPAVVGMGTQICQWEAQGITGASDLADKTIAQMPMSTTAAIQLQVLAEYHLGC